MAFGRSVVTMAVGRAQGRSDKQALVPALMELTAPCARPMSKHAPATQIKNANSGAITGPSEFILGAWGRKVSWEMGHER